MKCTICGISVDSIDDAIDQGWVPFFYEGDEQHGPACADCCDSLLRTCDGGGVEVRDEFRGKIIYNDEEEPDDEPEEQLFMGLIFN